MKVINRHKLFQLPFYFFLSGSYVVVKYLVSPFIYVARRLGLKPELPRRIDSEINRICLPLTEHADEIIRNDIKAALKIGDELPSIPVLFSDGYKCLLTDYADGFLMLIFIRGSWCSYSRLHLADINSSKQKFDNADTKLVAVTSYTDYDEWRSRGIELPMIIDQRGELFKAFGVSADSWIEYAWGRTIPHEGVFLFDAEKKLVATDIRRVNPVKPRQSFLSSKAWLELIRQHSLIHAR